MILQRIIISLGAILICLQSAAQKDVLIPFKDGALWGFSNTRAELVIPAKYKRVNKFYKNQAKIYSEKGVGIIDENGQELLSPIYYQCNNIKEDYFQARIGKKGNWAIFKKNDTKLSEYIFHSLKTTKEGIIVSLVNIDGSRVKINKGVLRQNGAQWDTIVPLKYKEVFWQGQHKCFGAIAQGSAREKFYFDTNGAPISKPTVEDDEGYVIESVAPEPYERAKSRTLKSRPFEENNKMGYIHVDYLTKKADTIAAVYDSLRPTRFSPGFYFVKKRNKWGYLNSKTGLVIPHQFREINFKSHNNIYQTKTIKENGRTKVIQVQDEYFYARKKKEWGLMARNKENIFEAKIPFEYSSIESLAGRYFIAHLPNTFEVYSRRDYKKIIPKGKYKKISVSMDYIGSKYYFKILNEANEILYVGTDGTEYFRNQKI